MAEYISREVLLKAIEKLDRLDKETNTQYEYDKEGYILLIQNAPTANVVEVVRCKDCKYSERYQACEGSIPLRCNNPKHIEIGLPDNHFCSYGERSDNND